jgi:drug/metabolite transporter (DMT)-like permease
MNLIWILLVLVCSILWGIGNIVGDSLSKKRIPGMKGKDVDIFHFVSVWTFHCVWISILLLLYKGVSTGFSLPREMHWIIGAGALHFFITFAFFKCFNFSEATVISPIAQIFPIFALIFSGIFLNESLGVIHALAFVIMMGGALNIAKKSNGSGFKLNKVFFIILGTGVLVGIYYTIIRYLTTVKEIPDLEIFSWSRVGSLFAFIIYYPLRRIHSPIPSIRSLGKNTTLILLGGMFAVVFGTVLNIPATKHGPSTAIVVVSLCSIIPVFTFIFSYLLAKWKPWYGEGRNKGLRKNIIWSIIVALGLVLTLFG